MTGGASRRPRPVGGELQLAGTGQDRAGTSLSLCVSPVNRALRMLFYFNDIQTNRG
jgi:hypothetical protein